MLDAAMFYSRIAPGYNAPFHRNFYRRIASNLLDRIPPGPIESVLEIGSGTGHATAVILDRYPLAEIVALEPASPMLAQTGIDSPNIRWMCSPLSGLANETFDLVLASMSYHWLDPDERAKAMNMGKNGVLALALPASDSQTESEVGTAIKGLLFKFRGEERWPKAVRREDSVLADLKENFKEIAVSKLMINEIYENAADLFDCLYVRGALFSLFGDQARAAGDELATGFDGRSDLNFCWPISLIVARNTT